MGHIDLHNLPLLTAAMGRSFAALRKRRRITRSQRNQCLVWQHMLTGEHLLLQAWNRADVSQSERNMQMEQAHHRFEAQWTRYSEGLEDFIRAEAQKSGTWTCTLDASGQAVWL